MNELPPDEHCRCACTRAARTEGALASPPLREHVPLAASSRSHASPTIQEILSLRSRETGVIREEVFPPGDSETRQQGVTRWLKTHARSVAFTGGLATVLIGVALFSLATSGTQSSAAPVHPSPSSATSSALPASDEPSDEMNDGASAPDGFLRSVITGDIADPLAGALRTQLGCVSECAVVVRVISATGDVSISVISSIGAAGLVRARSVIVESTTGGMRIRQIIQPATQSATG